MIRLIARLAIAVLITLAGIIIAAQWWSYAYGRGTGQIVSTVSEGQSWQIGVALARETGWKVPTGCVFAEARLSSGRDPIFGVRIECDEIGRQELLASIGTWQVPERVPGFVEGIEDCFEFDAVVATMNRPVFLESREYSPKRCHDTVVLYEAEPVTTSSVIYLWYQPCLQMPSELSRLFNE